VAKGICWLKVDVVVPGSMVPRGEDGSEKW